MTSKLYPHEIKDTGVKVMIRKVSPVLLREFMKRFPEPKPPVQEVMIGGPDGHKEMQENRDHPDYLRAMTEHNEKLQDEMNRFLIRRGVVIELTDEQREEVRRLREEWLEDTGSELEGDDKYIYIMYIAIGTDSDFAELINAIWRRSDVTQEEIDQSMKSFRS